MCHGKILYSMNVMFYLFIIGNINVVKAIKVSENLVHAEKNTISPKLMSKINL